MSVEENKAIVGRWFSEFWGKDFNPAVIDELAAPDIRFSTPCTPRCADAMWLRVRRRLPGRLPRPRLRRHR
jgi:hypothetical protein